MGTTLGRFFGIWFFFFFFFSFRKIFPHYVFSLLHSSKVFTFLRGCYGEYRDKDKLFLVQLLVFLTFSCITIDMNSQNKRCIVILEDRVAIGQKFRTEEKVSRQGSL